LSLQSYEKTFKAHLDEYRRGRLGGVESGMFLANGVERPYGHILPTKLQWLNILEPFRAEVMHYQSSCSLRLHRYFHHLSSSQAFAFNLFIPLFQHAPLMLAAALNTPAVLSLQLEQCADPDERTQVDVQWMTDESTCVYCEVELSEAEFGTADGMGRHPRKLEETYRPVLERYVSTQLWDDKGERFYQFYQVYRNLWLAARSGHETDEVRFLLPRANETLVEKLHEALSLVGPALKSRTRIVYVEDVLRHLARSVETAWYGRLLEEKYVPSSQPDTGPFSPVVPTDSSREPCAAAPA
jgi:hypothetical protein